jgi:Predicted amidophosphoribosyltransferases
MALPRTNQHLVCDNEIEKNLWGKVPLGRATSFLYYSKGGDVREILYEMKYHANNDIGRVMGRIMASELYCSGFFFGIDYLVPAPLHVKKEKKRGYNQSICLCKGISEITSIPIADQVLQRREMTETQTHKGVYERWNNVSGAFVANECPYLKEKNILLVDDVLTTGATIVACADSLKNSSLSSISVLTLAVASD